MDKPTQEWLKMSEYDLETAQAMLQGGRYLYVAFMCQQSLEKLLKAVYSQVKKEIPPKTHNLLYLVDVLSLNISEAQRDLLARLNQYYLGSRYPDQREQLAQAINKQQSQGLLDETKEAWSCLKQQLQ